MKHRKTITILLGIAFVAVGVAAADTYELDPAHTTIGFSIEHLVISKVKGRFGEFSGTVTFDPNATPPVQTASATIKVASVDTGIQKRDEDLRSDNFLDVANYPEMKFESKKIEKQGTEYTATGTLTLHGVSKEIALPFTVKGPIKDPWGNTRLGIQARTTINRKDYGLTWNKVLETGGLVVGDEVEIEIQAEAVKKEPAKQ